MITMRTRVLRLCAAAALAGAAFGGVPAAQAEDGNWYIGATMPLMFIDDSKAISEGSFTLPDPRTGQPATTDYRAQVETSHDTGFKLGGMLGYEFGDGLRVEGELFFARADVSTLTHSSITVPALSLTLQDEVAIPVTGSGEQLGAMVNVWYDIETDDAWTPFIGGGLGLIRIDQSDLKYDTGAVAGAVATHLKLLGAQQAALAMGLPPPQEVDPVQLPPGLVPSISSADTALAWQIGMGVGYALSETATLQFGYRLQALNGLNFRGSNAMASVNAETDLRIHFLEIGIRQRF